MKALLLQDILRRAEQVTVLVPNLVDLKLLVVSHLPRHLKPSRVIQRALLRLLLLQERLFLLGRLPG